MAPASWIRVIASIQLNIQHHLHQICPIMAWILQGAALLGQLAVVEKELRKWVPDFQVIVACSPRVQQRLGGK
jgi:hypothetical protein